jgi:hypothetical protein
LNSFQKADILALAIARHYERKHGPAVVSVGNAPKWDVRFEDGFTAEIKCDEAAARTFNACVEFWNERKNCPSGILATAASHWVHCLFENGGVQCYEIEVKKLLKLCLESGTVKQGGDYNASRFKLIPMAKLAEIANDSFRLEGELVPSALA